MTMLEMEDNVQHKKDILRTERQCFSVGKQQQNLGLSLRVTLISHLIAPNSLFVLPK
jgi:hypothetical protein